MSMSTLMSKIDAAPEAVREERGPGDDARRTRLLDAAFATFVRFGFRKTSMEEVARAAHLSRQALYLHFATKEKLFRAAVHHALESGLARVSGCMRDASASVEDKLARAFDAWVGRYVGVAGADVTDLEEAGRALVGPLIAEHEAQFLETITKIIRSSPLPGAYRSAGVSARQLAETLYATARGLKHDARSREEFAERFGVAIRVLCMPLRSAR